MAECLQNTSAMSAERKNEVAMFILPEDIQTLKKNRNSPDIRLAINNVEKLQKFEPITDNTLDFLKVETDSLRKAMDEGNLDIVLRLLPTYIRDVENLLRRK